MNLACIDGLTSHLIQAHGAADLETTITPDLCPPGMCGDVTVNCFRIAKAFGSNPMSLAQEAASYLDTHPDVSQVEQIKAFVNITLEISALYRDTIADMDGLLGKASVPVSSKKRILIEYSAPNTNKPQHLGHVRNNTLGSALCSILSSVGHDVTAVNLINDRGIHICKSMLGYQRFGDDSSPESAGEKGDHFVGGFYVLFEKEVRRQADVLKASRPEFKDLSYDELFPETEVGQSAQELLRLWESNDSDTRDLWQKMNNWVLSGFDETYKRMGVAFDRVYFESATYEFGKEVINRTLKIPVFYRRDDGATEIDLDDVNLGKKVVLRSDGTSVYVTQDIGTTIRKHEDFAPDSMIWIVGDEQIHHFKVLFAILAKMGIPWSDQLHHIPYGMVNLPSGRMKSREGIVVDADELFDEMTGLAREATLERWADEVPADLDERSEIIGMGALKFMLLKVNPKTTMTFDPNASMKFEGDTGPYVQYVYARIASILRKLDANVLQVDTDWSLLKEPEERLVAIQCGFYPAILLNAAGNFDTSVVANYLLDLTKAFNRFYKKHSVLSAATNELTTARVALCRCVQTILREGLRNLSIQTLESM